ncbi:hypothetical protein NYO91_07300 [Arhodomonas aquaeolei]|uniref:hypothetical protein n=1 Tax=Arhodomonas aquaeolei TaxID=2369 RepID=UPI00216A1B46|nr:hypothetical protein [Arhodomonas aquaeolei]MCS4503882.1 hypothetical protein [Arhodomonas aquaeolei]
MAYIEAYIKQLGAAARKMIAVAAIGFFVGLGLGAGVFVALDATGSILVIATEEG